MSEQEQDMSRGYYAQIDPIALHVVSDDDESSGVTFGVTMSSKAAALKVLHLMDWEELDLFETHDFQAVYDRRIPTEVLAYSLIAYLRFRTFDIAMSRGVGIRGVNERVKEHALAWMRKLSELWTALRQGEEPSHKWVN